MKPVKQTTSQYVLQALETKKEVKIRLSNGENLNQIVEERGYRVVFPV